MDDSRWHILRVKPGQEDAVALLSTVPAYVPRHTVVTFNRRQRKVVRHVEVMLKGFVFLLIRAPSDIERLLPAHKVFGFLRNVDRTFATLTRRAFELLRVVEREANVAKPQVVVDKKPLRVGEMARVTLSLYEDARDALIEEIKGNKVIVRMLRSQLRVETTLAKLA